MNITKKLFNYIILKFEPFIWTVIKNHPSTYLNGNNQLFINYERFFLISKFFFKNLIKKNNKVLDVGIYPGTTVKLLQELSNHFKFKNSFDGLGIGFDSQFKNEMKKIDVNLYEFDLENLNDQFKKIPKLKSDNYDFIILTDVIEHLQNPYIILGELYRLLKKNGKLMISTDNVSRFDHLISLLKGRSTYVPLLESNMFYSGDWRPHFREYDKMELIKLGTWNGFKLIEHKYYESYFGTYFKIGNKLIKRKKISLYHFVKKIFIKTNHKFMDNQILILEKVELSKNFSKPNHTSDDLKWNETRKKFKIY